MNKKAQVKFAIYFVVVLVLGVVSYYYYNFLEKSTSELAVVTQDITAPRIKNRNLETGVLESKKFKDLQKINVEEEYLNADGQTASTTPKPSDLAKVPKRQSNPFKPF